MTKAQKKKQAVQQRLDFIEQAYALILDAIPEKTRGERCKLRVQLTHEGLNRYIRFMCYGKTMNFLLYGDGNVFLELSEACHNDHREQLFMYVDNMDDQAEFLRRLAEILWWLIRVFLDLDCFTFHAYMDYVSHYGDIEVAHIHMSSEYEQYYGEKTGKRNMEVDEK